MSEAFRNLEAREIQSALIQFMGENLGELKQLDSSLVNKNPTLQGLTLQPEAILKSVPYVPQPQPPPQPQQIPQPPQTVAPAQAIPVPVQAPVVVNDIVEDKDQLTFDFINDLKNEPSLKEKILAMSAKVDRIESYLVHIDQKVTRLLERPAIKKKTQEEA